MNWDHYFMEIARTVALRSKDPATRVGAVIVEPVTHAVKATGYNGMPAGMIETPELWERPTKYKFICHAEANAIHFAARNGAPVSGCTLYVTGLFPCSNCAKAIVQSGIKRVVVPRDHLNERWLEEIAIAKRILIETGVAWDEVDSVK
jgi:dCMP deaminase